LHAIDNKYKEFVLDALRDAQQVQVGEQRCDVVMTLSPDCETCDGINDILQSVQLAAWQSSEGYVAVSGECCGSSAERRITCRRVA